MPQTTEKSDLILGVINERIQPKLVKWETQILFMCLMARPQKIEEPLGKDRLVLFYLLQSAKKALYRHSNDPKYCAANV